jgi:hypothetical protein
VTHQLESSFRCENFLLFLRIRQVGRWVGVVLDEPKGKNNGTIKGTTYFTVSLSAWILDSREIIANICSATKTTELSCGKLNWFSSMTPTIPCPIVQMISQRGHGWAGESTAVSSFLSSFPNFLFLLPPFWKN